MADDPDRPAEAELPAAGTAAWYHREASLPDGRWKVRCLFSDDHPDGAVVDRRGDLSGRFEIWRADVDDQGRPRVLVNPDAAPGAPAMWFVVLPEAPAPRPAMTLVGYADRTLPAGTVITDAVFFHLPVRNDDQVGAIRWWHEDAVVDQVYVGPAWRRSHVASALIYAASAYHQLHGWPGRLHSDGRRTSLGEQLVAGLRHPDRIAPLSKLMPPMDPDGRGPSDPS
jgi:GNAT superfamily N-acetyltransferase